MKVHFHKDGKEGSLVYDEPNQEVLVAHPDDDVRRTVHRYLTNERMFTTNVGRHKDVVGDRIPMYATPIENKHFMEMALTEMRGYTGVTVNWAHPGNRKTGTDDSNAQADKPITKSLDDYDIIN